jgi:cation diffusion facilitator family transporter
MFKSYLSRLKDPKTFAMTMSILAAFLMLVGKITAYTLTQSSAIFADALESVVHLFATVIAALSLWYSQQPADKEHPYGHGKIAYFSAAGEAVVILFAAVSIIFMSIESLVNGNELEQLDTGLLVLSALAFINLLLGYLLLHTGKKYHSLVLVANGKHVLADMWTSIGVVLGVLVVHLTGMKWLDPLIAMAVGINIVITAGKLLLQSYQGLMEKASEDTDLKLHVILKKAQEEGVFLSYHLLRHRTVDNRLWVEFHLQFEDDASLKLAHEKACVVEMRIQQAFSNEKLYITSHLEPENHQQTHPKGHPETENTL